MQDETQLDESDMGQRRWLRRGAVVAFVFFAATLVYFSNLYLTERFTENTRNRAELRLALYIGNLVSELQRNSIVPQLLARDPELIRALEGKDYALSSHRLLSYVEEIGAASLVLLDNEGRTVAATDRGRLGQNLRNTDHFVTALRSNTTTFSTEPTDAGGFAFVYARKIEHNGLLLGVIAVEVDLARLERSWAGIADAVFVTDSVGQIILTTEPRWRGHDEQTALAVESAPSALERAARTAVQWTTASVDAYVEGQAVLRREARVPFQGWRMVTYTGYTSVRERVNGVLALEIMGFALLLALIFWLSSRQARSRLMLFQRESAQLRRLNMRLQREIAERAKVEKSLQVAEQTLVQSSKLAVLGEMSAAVSHELNQPLAAMKTYLAGARLLLQRQRSEEALASFHRIDDLIERMGAITRQLKSYARKGSDAYVQVDVGEALGSALAIMEPQLRSRDVEITRNLPDEPVVIFGDRVRLEQVIINLLRNALDATKEQDQTRIDILVTIGEMMRLSVEDNGPGIEDLDALFEPFYTTKQPGDGVGLGLAISSGIAVDLGGRLLARNAAKGGAVFELQLPIYEAETHAAE